MRIKRFTARDLPAATNMIKQEFGLAAIILSQRDLSADQGGGVEITAGVRDEDLPSKEGETTRFSASPDAPKPRAGLAVGAAAYRKAEQNFLAQGEDLSAIKQQIEKTEKDLGGRLDQLKDLILDLAHRQNLAEKWRSRPDLVKLYRQLMDTGLAAEYGRSLVENAAESARAWGGNIEENIRKAMRPKLRIADFSLNPPKVLALVGPSGAGKTASLVNLAAFYRQRGLSVAAITLDTLRLGAADQLTQYARILGLGVRICQNHDEFKEALDLFSQMDIILIDTPSRGFQKNEGRQELASYFNEAEAVPLLVLPAIMKEADLKASLARTRLWREAGIVITKFDETASLGDLFGFFIAEAPRLAFFSLGPKTSEDFVVATQEKILDLWLGNREDQNEDDSVPPVKNNQ